MDGQTPDRRFRLSADDAADIISRDGADDADNDDASRLQRIETVTIVMQSVTS